MKRGFLFLVFYLLFSLVEARVTLPKFIDHNMVLQQQSECNIWGKADAKKDVIIMTSWDHEEYVAKADSKGNFKVKVKTPKAGGPYSIAISDGSEMLELHNIMIGEVWICSGQSNMEMQMKGFKAQPVEGTAEELMHCQDSLLRLFTVKRHASLSPEWDVTGQWNEANSASVRDFSATAYYFGRALR